MFRSLPWHQSLSSNVLADDGENNQTKMYRRRISTCKIEERFVVATYDKTNSMGVKQYRTESNFTPDSRRSCDWSEDQTVLPPLLPYVRTLS
jgi:hypothetical protein